MDNFFTLAKRLAQDAEAPRPIAKAIKVLITSAHGPTLWVHPVGALAVAVALIACGLAPCGNRMGIVR